MADIDVCQGAHRAGSNALQSAFSKAQRTSDETLLTVYVMGMYENFTCATHNGSFLAHKEGANALLQLRRLDEYYTNPTSARLYEVSYAQMVGISRLHIEVLG